MSSSTVPPDLVQALRQSLAARADVQAAAIVPALGLHLQEDAPDARFGPPVEVLAAGSGSAVVLGAELKAVAREHGCRLRLTLLAPEAF